MTPVESARNLPCFTAPTRAVPLEGGITNHNIRVTDQGRDYVVRLGADIPEHMIDRANELRVSRAAHACGVAPGVVHHEPGALVLEFIDSTALDGKDLHDSEVLRGVVDLIHQLHTQGPLHLRGPVQAFWVFHILRDYAATLRVRASPHVPLLADLLAQAETLERAVGPVTLVLGHNDLLPANILNDGARFWLIDWEYGGFNSPLFDLGGLATNAGLPQEAERAMLTRYFAAAPDASLWQSYSAMKCASLLRETMWSMVSEITSQLDFDYAAYTADNLARYRAAFAAFQQEPTP